MKSHLRSLEVIQPSSYLDDPTIVEPKNNEFWITAIAESHNDSILCWFEILHVPAVPDLPVMYGGGVLHIQSHSLSTETLFQLGQTAALLAAVCLQGKMNGSETTAQTE